MRVENRVRPCSVHFDRIGGAGGSQTARLEKDVARAGAKTGIKRSLGEVAPDRELDPAGPVDATAQPRRTGRWSRREG